MCSTTESSDSSPFPGESVPSARSTSDLNCRAAVIAAITKALILLVLICFAFPHDVALFSEWYAFENNEREWHVALCGELSLAMLFSVFCGCIAPRPIHRHGRWHTFSEIRSLIFWSQKSVARFRTTLPVAWSFVYNMRSLETLYLNYFIGGHAR